MHGEQSSFVKDGAPRRREAVRAKLASLTKVDLSRRQCSAKRC